MTATDTRLEGRQSPKTLVEEQENDVPDTKVFRTDRIHRNNVLPLHPSGVINRDLYIFLFNKFYIL